MKHSKKASIVYFSYFIAVIIKFWCAMSTNGYNQKYKPRTIVNSYFKHTSNNFNLNTNSHTEKCIVVSSNEDYAVQKTEKQGYAYTSTEKTQDKEPSNWSKDYKNSEKQNLSLYTIAEEKDTNLKVYDRNSYNTVSLNIESYENTGEISNSNCNAKVLANEKHTVQPFAFLRQQQSCPTNAEMMQFKASQKLIAPSSAERKGRPKGSVSKKTVASEARRNNISQRYINSILETMNEQQARHFKIAIERAAKAEKELAEERLRTVELQNQLTLSQNLQQQLTEKLKIEEAARKFAEENLVMETQRRKEIEETYKQVTTEIFTTKQKLQAVERESAKNILTLEKNVAESQEQNKNIQEKIVEISRKLKEQEDEAVILFKCNQKLQASLTEMAHNYRSSKIQMEQSHNLTQEMQTEKEKLMQRVTKLEEASSKIKSKLPIRQKRRPLHKQRFIPYDTVSARTQRRRVQKQIRELESVPEIKEKILSRFKPKTTKTNRKITPLQTVTMTAIVGFNPNQIENLKSILRFFDADILPPIHKIRKALTALKNEFEYEELEDKELGVVGRQILDIKNVIAIRGERLMESGRWVDVPGFEDFAFIGLTADSGGGFLECAISMMNVEEGWGSPNNATIVASGKIPAENYEVVKFVCGNSFQQINQLDGKKVEFNVHDVTVTKTIIVIVCFDGKIACICSGHSGSASSLPCYCCVSTKKQINDGRIGPLRNPLTMLQQANLFTEKKDAVEKPSEAFLTKLRAETQCITKPPLLTIDYSQWIYGVLHAIMGPTIKALDVIEDIALKEDLKDLQILLPSSKELRKSNKDLNTEIVNIKGYIAELNAALKTSKAVFQKWKKIRKNPSQEESVCGAKYCLQNIVGNNALFNNFLKCKCGNFIHSTCDLYFMSYEIEYEQENGYLCPRCDPLSVETSSNDLISRQTEWEADLNKLKDILKDKENAAQASKLQIPYDKCIRYQAIQEKLKELKVRKNLYFQKLNGVDVRKLIKNRESFIQVVREDLREDVKSLFTCLNTYQELAEKHFLTDEDINRLDPIELKRAYKAICGEDVPLKVHHLTDHTPLFMVKFHFYQLINDHAIEHIHRIVNVLLQKLCISKDEPQKSLKAITDTFSLRNKLFDLGINIDNLRNLSYEEKQQLINSLDTL